ncbi:peptidoglycan-binding protein [Streptosporangiaceae bacterium NEAU-GS5]|nr:peptidoglycan-binding protein [Streptosporangiaceae bacterium NEAU-GS5]
MPPERLDIGSVGEDVAWLHKALEARGFAVSAEEEKRRFFGPSTRDALRDCQTCHGLNATGEVDDPTTALLNATRRSGAVRGGLGDGPGLDAGRFEHPGLPGMPEPCPQVRGPACTAAESAVRTVTQRHPFSAPRIGDRGDDVRRLQATLQLLGAPVPDEETSDGVFGAGTETALRDWQRSVRLEASGVPDERTSEWAQTLLVRQPVRIVLGQVTTQEGRPVQGLVVRAYDANLVGDHPIAVGDGMGPAVTGPDGRFELRYSAADLGRPGKAAPDLVLRAYPDAAAAEPVASSPVMFGAEPVALVPLVVGVAVRPSTLDRLLGQVTPALNGTRLAAVDTAAGLTYLAGTTGVPQSDVATLVHAAALAEEADRLVDGDAGAAAATAAARTIAVFYAWVRADPPADLDSVLGTPAAVLADRLAQAAADGLVPPGADREAVTGAIIELQARRMLRPAGPGKPVSIGDVLGTIPADRRLDDVTALAVSRMVAEEGGRGDGFWHMLSAAGLGEAQVRDIRLAFALDDLSRGDLRLIQALQAVTPVDHDGTTVHLAPLRPNRWMEIVATAAGDGADGGRIPADAAELAQRVERLHPSATFRANLDVGLLRQTGYPAARVADFLGEHPGFDLVTTTVEPFLAEAGLAGDGELRAGLLTAQRMVRIGADQGELDALARAGVGDIALFALRDRGSLATRLSDKMPESRLAMLHGRAQRMLTAALGAATVFAPRFGAAPSHRAAAAPVPAGFPSVQQLFGDQSGCECGTCRSVLGPSAYLVDLLHLLDRTGFGGQLQNRRPDLAELELSCANTDTPLPYVDLVLEILEAAAALPSPAIALTPAEADQLENGSVPAPLQAELAKHAADELGTLSVEVAAAQVLIFPPFWRVVVRDRKRRWPARLWRRRLGVRWTSGAAIPGSALVPEARIDATRQALAAGIAPPDLVSLVAPEPEAPVVGVPTVTAAAPPDDQLEHTVELVRSMVIELAGGGWVGAVLILSVDGADIRGIQVQPGILVLEIARGLAAGQIHPYLANLVPPLEYQVTQEPRPPGLRGRWTLASTVTATVRFSPDQVVVQGLTYGSADHGDDALFPENRDPEAYRLLNAVSYPLDLPFDQFREEVRACLAIAGGSRLDLLRTLLPASRYVSVDDACEVLGAAPAQLAIITEPPASAARAAALWGLAEAGNSLSDPLDGAAPPVPADWVGALSRASVLLDRSGVELPTLQAMFATRYLAEVAADVHTDPAYECRPSRLTIAGLGVSSLDRLQRLLRLRRITDWPVRDTDMVLRALTRPGTDPLDGEAAIRALGHVAEIATRTATTARFVAVWLGAVETTGYVDLEAAGTPTQPSLYAEVFLDPRHLGAPGAADFALSADGTELAYLTGAENPVALTGRLAYASTALRLRPAELAELVGTGPRAVVADELTLPNLWMLQRQVTLARAAGISVRESRLLQSLTGISPLPSEPLAVDIAGRRILEFLDAIDAVRASGFTVAELAWCLDGTEVDEAARARRRLDQLRWLIDLQGALRDVQPSVSGEVTDVALRTLLRSAGWPDPLIDRVLGGEDDQLGLASPVVLDVVVTAAAAPALPPGGPFTLVVAEAGHYLLGLSRPPTAADFAALDQVAGLGPLADDTSPAAHLSSNWTDLQDRTRSLSRWLQSVALPRVSAALRFTVPAPLDGQNPRALPPDGLGRVMRLTAGGDVEIDGFLTAADAQRLRIWVAGASNEAAVRAAVAPLVGVPPALGVAAAPLSYEPVLRTLTLVGYPASADVPRLTALVDNASYTAAVQALVAAATAYAEQRPSRRLLDRDAVLRLFMELLTPQQRYAAVQDALVAPLRRQRAADLLSARTGIDSRLLDVLDAEAEAAAPPADLVKDLASEALLGVAIRDVRSADMLAHPLAALNRWDRAGLLVRRLGVLPAEAPWHGTAGFTGLDPFGLGPGADAAGSAYGRWRAAATLYDLRGIVPGAGATLERVRTAETAEAGIGALADAFEVAGADVTALLAVDTPVDQPAQLRSPAVLRRIVDAAQALRRLRVPAEGLEPVSKCAVGRVVAGNAARSPVKGSTTKKNQTRRPRGHLSGDAAV